MEVVFSLGGLFATGIKISDMLNRFISDVIHAPGEIRNLRSEVDTFTRIVSILQKKTPPRPSLNPLNHVSAALDAARETLSDLQRELDRVASHGSKLWEGIKYAYSEKIFGGLLQQLISHKLTLLLLASPSLAESSEERGTIVRRFTRDYAVTDFGYVSVSTNVTSSTGTNACCNAHPTLSRPFANELTSTRSVGGKPHPNHNMTVSAPVIATPYHNVTPYHNIVPSIAQYPVPSPPIFTTPQYSLHDAVRNKHSGAVYDLLHRGYDINQDHPDFGPPLAYAVCLGEARIVTYLLLFGANTKAKNRFGKGLLHAAVATGDELILYYLLAGQTPVNEADDVGDTALHTAAHYGYRKMIDLLIQWGADTERRNGRGLTPALSPWRVLKSRKSVTLYESIW